MSKSRIAMGCSVLLGACAKRVIPARTRRATALVSLYALLNGEEPSSTQLAALNNNLNLVSSVDSLKLPARIPVEIWGCRDTIVDVQDNATRETVILSCIPKWLVYGNLRDVASDVSSLLTFVDMRRTTHAVQQGINESLPMAATA